MLLSYSALVIILLEPPASPSPLISTKEALEADYPTNPSLGCWANVRTNPSSSAATSLMEGLSSPFNLKHLFARSETSVTLSKSISSSRM
ncbi:hypothetical protein ACE6H2_013679 [Prunus campanulata]